MIRYSIKVLPPKIQDIKISNVFVDKQICSDFNISKKFIKIPKKDYIFLQIMLKDMETMQNVDINYPHLYLDAYLYEEDKKDYTRKYLKFKRNGVIIKPKDKDLKIKIRLLRQEEVIDYCLIDIV